MARVNYLINRMFGCTILNILSIFGITMLDIYKVFDPTTPNIICDIFFPTPKMCKKNILKNIIIGDNYLFMDW